MGLEHEISGCVRGAERRPSARPKLSCNGAMLPADLWRRVFAMCCVETKLNLPKVCKNFAGLARSMQKSLVIRLRSDKSWNLDDYVALQKLTIHVGRANDVGFRVLGGSAVPNLVLKLVFVGVVELSRVARTVQSLPWRSRLVKVDVDADVFVLDADGAPELCSTLACTTIRASATTDWEAYPFRHLRAGTCPSHCLRAFTLLRSLCIENGRCRDLTETLSDGDIAHFPQLSSLCVEGFVVSSAAPLEGLTCLHHVEMRSCDFSPHQADVGIMRRSFSRVRSLHLIDCDLPVVMDIGGLADLRVLRIDNGLYDNTLWVSGRSRLALLKELYVRNATMCVEEVEGWTAATRVELVDCMFDGPLVSIYHKLLKAAPRAYCLLGFTVGPADEEYYEIQEMYDAVCSLTTSHQKVVLDNNIIVHKCVGCKYFNNVKGLLFDAQ